MDPVSRITINVWPPMLNVLSTGQPHRTFVSAHTLQVQDTRYPPGGSQSKNSRATTSSLSDAQVVMVLNREFRRKGGVSYSRGRGVEINAG